METLSSESLHQIQKATSNPCKVTLLNWFREPFNNSVATARTCYSSRVIWPQEVSENEERQRQRDAIASSTYKAGHHTILQHSNFQFVLEGVSRQFLWSFLHAHPFYNSEQVSQRYVEVKPENFYIPALPPKALQIYLACNQLQMSAYQKLIQVLKEPTQSQYCKIFPNRDMANKKWQNAIKKRSMEVARYVLPVGTAAHLYHTVNGITLFRYHRLCQQPDVPEETRLIVGQMIEAVRQIDADFFQNLEETLPKEETLESKVLQKLAAKGTLQSSTPQQFIDEFDASLDGKTSKLIAYDPQSEKTIASSIRSMLGLTASALADREAIDLVLNPAQNPYLSESLNLNSLSKLMRSLNHCHFTFRKKISHTADSQDQRHRLTPGSRPVLQTQFRMNTPDFIEPPLIQISSEATELYRETMQEIWQHMAAMVEEGASLESALYLLPNAFPIRFEESGDLMAFHHKWTTRLCYTAQEEIWNNCHDEVLQVKELFPELGRYLLPPCTLRNLAGVTPYCPEGDRYCGVRVWKLDVENFDRLL